MVGWQHISSPVMLTIGEETALTLNVELEPGFIYGYTVSGRLLSQELPVAGKQVGIRVNGSIQTTLTTAPDGSFSGTLTLPAVDSQYVGTKSAYGYLANGTRYEVCRTIQHNLRPVSNATVLIVTPQGTYVYGSQKTPEEMQQEAQQSGWLSIWHEWSWWYPWFRLHYKLNVNLPQGNPNIDYGWTFLPFGETYNANNHVLANILNDVSYDIQTDILVDFMVGMIIQFGIGVFLGRTGIWTAVAILTYAAYSLGSALYLHFTSEGKPEAWLGAFITSAIGGTSGLVLSGISSISGLLTSTSRLIFGKIHSVMNSLWAQGLNFFNITGASFALIDFAFMVFYLNMYLTSI